MIIKKYDYVCYSILKPLIKIQIFEQFERSLICWLDREIQDGEKLEELIGLFRCSIVRMRIANQLDFGSQLKLAVMFGLDDIILMVVIS